MRTVIFLILVIFNINQALGDELGWHFVEESKGHVLYAITPTLHMNYVVLDIDDDYYASIQMIIDYKGLGGEKQLQSLKKTYPDLQLKRVSVTGSSGALVKVPGLEKELAFETSPTPLGPYFMQTVYLNKKQARKVKGAIEKRGQSVSVILPASVFFKKKKVVERKRISLKKCEEMFDHGYTLSGALMSMEGISKEFNKLDIKYETTKKQLVKKFLRSCFTIRRSRVDSVRELLSMELIPRKSARFIYGETVKEVDHQEKVELPVHSIFMSK